jgi:hypothetical protein
MKYKCERHINHILGIDIATVLDAHHGRFTPRPEQSVILNMPIFGTKLPKLSVDTRTSTDSVSEASGQNFTQ